MIFLLIFTGMGSVSIDFPTSTTNKLLQQAAAASVDWAWRLQSAIIFINQMVEKVYHKHYILHILHIYIYYIYYILYIYITYITYIYVWSSSESRQMICGCWNPQSSKTRQKPQ